MGYGIAIVGSGPSGLYMAEELLKHFPEASIDIIDALPTPYGLVRGGIAPDHQTTKAVVRAFERTFARRNVRFLGNVEVGRDLSYEELKAAYDLVVLSIGAARDRRLGIPGEDTPGVYGAAAFVGWYNGHPQHRDLSPLLDGEALAVVGNGNVALDVVRVVAKTPAELSDSDIAAHAQRALAAARFRDLYVIGRRRPLDASFTPLELAEFGQLERCGVVVHDARLTNDVVPETSEKELKVKLRNLEILRRFAASGVDGKPCRVHFVFQAAPVEVLGGERVRALVLERTRVEEGRAVRTGERFELPVDVVVAAIGYTTVPFPGVPFDDSRGVIANDEGYVEPGVYAAGWCKHGPRGVVGTNRTDAQQLTKRILTGLESTPPPGGKPGGVLIDRLLSRRAVRVVDFARWQRIDAAEVACAAPGKPREKFVTIQEMLEIE